MFTFCAGGLLNKQTNIQNSCTDWRECEFNIIMRKLDIPSHILRKRDISNATFTSKTTRHTFGILT